MRLHAILFLAFASTFATAAACGGGGGLSLEEYFTRMETISKEADQSSSDLEAQFNDDISGAKTEEDQLKIAAGYFADSADQSRAAFDKVKAVKPPKDVKKEHEEFVSAADELVKLFDEVVQRANDAKTTAGLEELAADLDKPPYSDANDRADAACFALQDIADKNNIDVDLTCGENSATAGGSTPASSAADLEAYFTEIDSIFEDADSELNGIGDDLDAALAAATTDADQVEAFRESFQRSNQAIKDAIGRMNDTEPPAGAQDAHNSFVGATQEVRRLSQQVLDALKDMETSAEIEAYFNEIDPQLTAATDAGDTACFELQDIADQNNISVDLNCAD